MLAKTALKPAGRREEKKAFDGWVFSLADCGKQESRTFDRVNTII